MPNVHSQVKCPLCYLQMRRDSLPRHFKQHPGNSLANFDLSLYKVNEHHIGDLNPNKIACIYCQKPISKKHMRQHHRVVHKVGVKRRYGTCVY
jgi:hypothetical protein